MQLDFLIQHAHCVIDTACTLCDVDISTNAVFIVLFSEYPQKYVKQGSCHHVYLLHHCKTNTPGAWFLLDNMLLSY